MIEGVEGKMSLEIILNIKQIVLSSENDEPVVMYLRERFGPVSVVAGDITPPAGVEIHNPDSGTPRHLNEKGAGDRADRLSAAAATCLLLRTRSAGRNLCIWLIRSTRPSSRWGFWARTRKR